MKPQTPQEKPESSTTPDANSSAPGHIDHIALLGLLLFVMLISLVVTPFASTTGSSNLVLTVGEQQELKVVGDNVILKIRLISGVTAKLWGDASCGAPIQKAMVITGSGSYTIPLFNTPHQNRDYVCLLSSNGSLHASAIWPHVHSGNTSTTISSHLPTPSVVGQPVAIAFSTTPETAGVGTPTGNVTVSDGGGGTCTATVAAGSCSITFALSGNKNLAATYGGDGNFDSSTSSGVTHTVNRTNTTTTISSHTPGISVTGQPVAIGFSVTPATSGLGALTGDVTVSDGLGNACIAAVTAGSCSISFATPGVKALTASYAGDVKYSPGTSVATNHTVRDFSISVSPSSQNVKAGAATTYTLTVTPVSGFTGTVNLACSGAPQNSTCIMSPASIAISGTSAGTRIVTIQTTNSTAKGNYTLNFTATFGTGVPASGGLVHASTASLKVN